jgi:nucleoside triphosphate pyrophosphatase
VVVLASASPRRRELLRLLVPEFRVIPSAIEEMLEPGPHDRAALGLARQKARAVAAMVPDGLVLGADTLVVIDGEAFGKPACPAMARTMLARLRGRAHEVLTGVAVVDARSGLGWDGVSRSLVLMADYPDSLIEAYVASGSPFDKAGGYAIQDLDGALAAGVVGSYTNVIGLPLDLTRRLLVEAGAAEVSGTSPR